MKCPFVIKVCSKCHKLLVANNMNFSKDKKKKYGLRAYCKSCEKEHNKKYYENNKNEILKQQKQYKKDNPHVDFNHHIKERHGLDSNITKEQYYEILEYFGYKCAYCGCELDENNTTLDHIIPLSKGGATDPWCLVPCCRSCNASKRDKNYLLWLDGKEMLDKYEMLSRYVELMFDKYNK